MPDPDYPFEDQLYGSRSVNKHWSFEPDRLRPQASVGQAQSPARHHRVPQEARAVQRTISVAPFRTPRTSNTRSNPDQGSPSRRRRSGPDQGSPSRRQRSGPDRGLSYERRCNDERPASPPAVRVRATRQRETVRSQSIVFLLAVLAHYRLSSSKLRTL